MSNAKISLGVLQRISEFLAELPEDQIADLAEGRARLAYVRQGETEPVPATKQPQKRTSRQIYEPSEATTALVHRLEALSSREEVALELKDVKGKELKDIARFLNVPRFSALLVGDLRQEIVQATVGRRLDSIATRGFDGLRP